MARAREGFDLQGLQISWTASFALQVDWRPSSPRNDKVPRAVPQRGLRGPLARLNQVPNIIQGIDVGALKRGSTISRWRTSTVSGGELLEAQRTALRREEACLKHVTQISPRPAEPRFNNGICQPGHQSRQHMLHPRRRGEAATWPGELTNQGRRRRIASTRTGLSMGNPYLNRAREGPVRENVDTRADIYSLGSRLLPNSARARSPSWDKMRGRRSSR